MMTMRMMVLINRLNLRRNVLKVLCALSVALERVLNSNGARLQTHKSAREQRGPSSALEAGRSTPCIVRYFTSKLSDTLSNLHLVSYPTLYTFIHS